MCVVRAHTHIDVPRGDMHMYVCASKGLRLSWEFSSVMTRFIRLRLGLLIELRASQLALGNLLYLCLKHWTYRQAPQAPNSIYAWLLRPEAACT